MQKHDLTKIIMGKVVRFEERRTKLWLGKYIFILLLFIAVLIFLIYISVNIIQKQQTADLLAIFGEDREIIAEFWQDTVTTFWEELPLIWLGLGGLALTGIIIYLRLSGKKIQIIKNKRGELANIREKE